LKCYLGVNITDIDEFNKMPEQQEVHFEVSDYRKIKKKLHSRKIRHLVHFTRIENLESILKNGFLSREKLDRCNIKYINNDDDRWDGCKFSTCFSIEFPNYYLLNKFRTERYPGSKWVVILLNIDKVFETKNEKKFSHTNAAKWNITPSKCCEAFEQCFMQEIKENKKCQRREIQKYIKDYLPTDVQAEVLIDGLISTDCIEKIIFETRDDLCLFIRNLKTEELLNKNYIFDINNPTEYGDYFGRREDFPWEDR